MRGLSPWGIGFDIAGHLGDGSPGGDAVHNEGARDPLQPLFSRALQRAQ